MPPQAEKKLWEDELLANPHAVADKRARVRGMFAAIAGSYDINNRLHSLWQDQRWRRKAVKIAQVRADDVVVDVACGTGDLSIAFARGGAARVVGIDFTYEMLPIARGKGGEAGFEEWNLRSQISDLKSGIPDFKSPSCSPVFIAGDAMRLPLPDGRADVVSIAFGIRNVADPLAAIREFHRVLRPGGRLIVLEFSLPRNRVLRGLYNFYFRKILPRTATWISGDKTGAYRYLPESVNTFIGREQMLGMMRDAGFGQLEQRSLTLGVCVCYRGVKA